MPESTPEARRRTRAFARVLGPFVAVVTMIVAIRLPNRCWWRPERACG